MRGCETFQKLGPARRSESLGSRPWGLDPALDQAQALSLFLDLLICEQTKPQDPDVTGKDPAAMPTTAILSCIPWTTSQNKPVLHSTVSVILQLQISDAHGWSGTNHPVKTWKTKLISTRSQKKNNNKKTDKGLTNCEDLIFKNVSFNVVFKIVRNQFEMIHYSKFKKKINPNKKETCMPVPRW